MRHLLSNSAPDPPLEKELECDFLQSSVPSARFVV